MKRQMLITCAYCAWWTRTVNFEAPEGMPPEAQKIVASMGAAVFNHELITHVNQAHPGHAAARREVLQ